MNFVIVTHVPHILEQNHYFAYSPYVREMNVWAKYTDKLTIVAPMSNFKISAIDINYEHQNIEFIPIESFNLLRIKAIFDAILKSPRICWKIYKAMQQADHIHLRCPGNIGLLGSMVQILFPNKIKTAKYAGNWDPKSKQQWSYRLQKWILTNTFLTKNMQVLVYGQWESSSKNIKPFFTATYTEADKTPVFYKSLKEEIQFVFVGALVLGKKPLYAVQLVELLFKKGYKVVLSLYGEGAERTRLEQYINQNNLEQVIFLEGNQTQDLVKKAYEQSHFVILPSESEGWPKAVAEGMFWGCVPVATKVSCVPFMLDYGNRGVLLEMDIEKDFNQLEVLLRNETDYKIKSQKACDWSRQYTLDVFEEEISELLTK